MPQAHRVTIDAGQSNRHWHQIPLMRNEFMNAVSCADATRSAEGAHRAEVALVVIKQWLELSSGNVVDSDRSSMPSVPEKQNGRYARRHIAIVGLCISQLSGQDSGGETGVAPDPR